MTLAAIRIRMLIAVTIGCGLALSAPSHAQQRTVDLQAVLDSLPARVSFPTGIVKAKAAMVERSSKIHPALLNLSDEVSARGLSGLSSKAESLGVPVEDN